MTTQTQTSATPSTQIPDAQAKLIAEARAKLQAQREAQRTAAPAPVATGSDAAKKRADEKRAREEAAKRREAERVAKKTQREVDRAARLAARAEAQTNKLPALSAAAQAVLTAARSLTGVELGALAVHVRFYADDAARHAPKSDIEPGDVVRIELAQHPRYTGKIGVVSDASKLRAHVRVPDFDIEAYAFITNLTKLDPATLRPEGDPAPAPKLPSNVLDLADPAPASDNVPAGQPAPPPDAAGAAGLRNNRATVATPGYSV